MTEAQISLALVQSHSTIKQRQTAQELAARRRFVGHAHGQAQSGARRTYTPGSLCGQAQCSGREGRRSTQHGQQKRHTHPLCPSHEIF